MIRLGTGATGESLVASSPLPVPTEPREQTALFLRTLYTPHEWLFCGEKGHAGMIGRNIHRAGDWPGWIAAVPNRLRDAMRGLGFAGADSVTVTAHTPELLIANPLTGTEGEDKQGKPSYRCGACVAVGRFMLIEFDALPLPEQCAFWAGVIQSGTLTLRALTYSANKSVHGLVEIGAIDAASWESATDKILYAVANPDALLEQQADRACKNVDRLTRLPGAVRRDTGRVQSLLWLSTAPLRYNPAAASRATPAPIHPPTSAMQQGAPTPHPVARQEVQAVATPGTEPQADRVPRCRDCWNWTPDGLRHGCAAGIAVRPSPDYRGPCDRAVPVG